MTTAEKTEETGSIRVTQRFATSAERVFDAWLDPALTRRFLFATATGQIVKAEIDARVGGAYTIVDRRRGGEVAHTGTYRELQRPSRLVFSLTVPTHAPDASTVSIDIEPLPSGCELTLRHEVPGLPLEGKARAIEGWTTTLEMLADAIPEAALTCGTGLAQHATIPTRIGLLFRALADTLELHRTTLGLHDPKARTEDEAYQQLASSYRQLATLVQGVATRMSSYQDLPVGAHDESAFGAQHVAAFERYVKAQSRLLAALRGAAERDEQMLADMTAVPPPES